MLDERVHRRPFTATLLAILLAGAAGLALAPTRSAHASVPGNCTETPAPPRTAVSFPDATHGWSVGKNCPGVIRATADGGAHWTGQTPPPDGTQLTAVDFVDDLHGWAGGDGALISTNDGGVTWTDVPYPAPANVSSIRFSAVKFVDAQHGWALATYECTSACSSPSYLIATTDGGQSWTHETLPLSDRFIFLSAVDTQHVWVANLGPGGSESPALLYSSDGGRTWQAGSVPGYSSGNVAYLFSALDFVNASDGWLATQVDVLRSIDGGATWNSVGSVGPADLQFLDALHGFAVGTTCAGPSCAAGGTVWSTSDGGSTWTQQTSAPGATTLSSLSFVSTLTGWAVGEDPCQNEFVMATTDGGLQWTRQADPPQEPTRMEDVTFASATVVYAASADTCVVPKDQAASSLLVKSTDAGATWSTLPDSLPHGFQVGSISFASTSVGWVSGSTMPAPDYLTSLYKTTDGGQTWAAQTLPVSMSGPDISFIDTQNGWAAGNGLAHSSDGGSTWVRQSTPTDDVSFWGVDFSDTSHGWVLANDGSPGSVNSHIVHTVDGGTTWVDTAAPTPPSVSPQVGSWRWAGGSAYDASHAMFVASVDFNGSSYPNATFVDSTSDGGATWTATLLSSSFGYPAARPIKEVGPNLAWLAANYAPADTFAFNQLMYTSDGGRTWQLSTEAPCDSSVDAVAAGDAAHIVGVGTAVLGTAPADRGTIVSSQDGGGTWDHSYLSATQSTACPLSASGSSGTAYAGRSFSGVIATVGDADGGTDPTRFAARVYWGDGSTQDYTTAVTYDAASRTFSIHGTHTYGTSGTYTVSAWILDADGADAIEDCTNCMTVRAGGGYTMDAYGGLHPFGTPVEPLAPSDEAYWAGWPIARDFAVRSDRASGYVLDGWGGVHPFGGAPLVSASGYWPGWDIARSIVLDPCDPSGTSGYVLDGWGGIHPFGPHAQAVSGFAYWPGWDIAKAIVVNPCGDGGYTLDGWGGLHPFQLGSATAPPVPSGGAYWPGWDIARGLVITGDRQGYEVDGWGGVHPFGGAPAATGDAYWPGWDIVRGIATLPAVPGGYTLDAWGGVHPFSGAPNATISYYTSGRNTFRAID